MSDDGLRPHFPRLKPDYLLLGEARSRLAECEAALDGDRIAIAERDDMIRELELGREADRRRITELETAARAAYDAAQGATYASDPTDWLRGCTDAVDALRSVLAAEHTQPDAG